MEKLNDGTIVRKVEYKIENDVGWFERGFNQERQEYYMIDSYFDKDLPRWISKVKTPLVQGKGIPTALYLEIYLMKKLQVNLNELKKIIIFNVHEIESIFQLRALQKVDQETDLGELFRNTRLFKSRNNVIIQSGMKIDKVKIIPFNAEFSHIHHLHNKIPNVTKEEIEDLTRKYNIDSQEMLFWNFNVEIYLK